VHTLLSHLAAGDGDLFIAATAIGNDLPFAILNMKHFERIDNLQIVE